MRTFLEYIGAPWKLRRQEFVKFRLALRSGHSVKRVMAAVGSSRRVHRLLAPACGSIRVWRSEAWSWACLHNLEGMRHPSTAVGGRWCSSAVDLGNSKVRDEADVAIVGAGIVGLATARDIVLKFPRARVVVVEKEHDLVPHQTSHNR